MGGQESPGACLQSLTLWSVPGLCCTHGLRQGTHAVAKAVSVMIAQTSSVCKGGSQTLPSQQFLTFRNIPKCHIGVAEREKGQRLCLKFPWVWSTHDWMWSLGLNIPCQDTAPGSWDICWYLGGSRDDRPRITPILYRCKSCQGIDGIQHVIKTPLFIGLAVPSFPESL